jgi:hypothetical protein
MTLYQLTTDSSVIRLLDGALIPTDLGNTDWREYQSWLAQGNTPQPAPTPEPSTQPNFTLFLDLILVSDLYQSIVVQSTANSAVNTGLTVTMGALLLASNGRPNVDGLQAGINLLFSALTYTQADIDELTNILAQTNLSNLVTIPQP